ncbi:major tail protein [Clostridioides difficile]|uniref:Uncharacterized protein n=1 Tax=Clostridioides difficile TaxID=1496 RepID=A0AAN6A775_CLODI|nr:major tail protein [Clostridioides difficile]EQI80828.1 phage major tail, phi13 family protein [Clostridioides difficile Y401]EIS9475930.1 hypothetical protein [Clostridioides difficile]MBZ1123079.1 hypothetical protein [Clostridioides difficile]MCG3620511.1 hypothetical protein [Clostridioides difficile]MCI4852535.1 hypothetical protein [Clostridioides difficile]
MRDGDIVKDYKSKILYGLDNIHVCEVSNNSKPIKIIGGKSVNIEISQDYKYLKTNGYESIRLNGNLKGKGKLNVLELSNNEKALIFGYNKSKGGILVGNGNCTRLRLLFSRNRSDGEKVYYCIYNVMFNQIGLDAGTNTEKKNKSTLEIDFDVLFDYKVGGVYYAMDTLTGDKETLNNWFKEIQYPNRSDIYDRR